MRGGLAVASTAGAAQRTVFDWHWEMFGNQRVHLIESYSHIVSDGEWEIISGLSHSELHCSLFLIPNHLIFLMMLSFRTQL